jgi:hypothetical protein
MLVVRGTKKLRDRIRATPAGEGDVSTTLLGDWFATALFWRPQVALLVNERTLLPVYLPLAPAASLLDRVPDAIASVLRRHGVDDATIAAEVAAMSDVRIAPTDNRSVVGVMNEFSYDGEGVFHAAPVGLEELSLRMSQMIVGPLMKKESGSPDRELAAVLGAVGRQQHPSNVIAFPGSYRPEPAPAAKGRPPATANVFQLKVTIKNTKPPVWRRVLVDGASHLDEVHEVIQAAFGWWNYHLHQFEVDGKEYGVPDPDGDDWVRRRSMNGSFASTRSPPSARRSRTPTTSATGGSTRSPSRRSSRALATHRYRPALVVAGRVRRRIVAARGATRTCSPCSPIAPIPNAATSPSGSVGRSTRRPSTPPTSPTTCEKAASSPSTTDRRRPESGRAHEHGRARGGNGCRDVRPVARVSGSVMRCQLPSGQLVDAAHRLDEELALDEELGWIMRSDGGSRWLTRPRTRRSESGTNGSTVQVGRPSGSTAPGWISLGEIQPNEGVSQS